MEVSGLSHWDYVNLVGHYHKLSEGELISPEVYEKGYTEAQIKHLEQRAKEQRGFNRIKSLDLLFQGSLQEYEYSQFNYVMTIYNQYKIGMLPFEGPLADQPAQIIDIMSVISQLQFEAEKRQRDEYERQQKRRAR